MYKGEHRANENHSQDEFTKSMRKLKSKQPAVFLSQDENEYIVKILSGDFGGDHVHFDYDFNEYINVIAGWADSDGVHSTDEVNFINDAEDELHHP